MEKVRVAEENKEDGSWMEGAKRKGRAMRNRTLVGLFDIIGRTTELQSESMILTPIPLTHTHTLTHSISYKHSPTHSHTHTHTYCLIRSLTHSLTHLFTY